MPCVDGYRTVVTREEAGFISNIASPSTSPSSSSAAALSPHLCPWRIRATDDSKHVELSVYDFERTSAIINGGAFPGDTGKCHQYAVVGDFDARHETNVCSGDKQRQRHIHRSTGNSVDVKVMTRADVTNKDSIYFLLRFQGQSKSRLMY